MQEKGALETVAFLAELHCFISTKNIINKLVGAYF